MRLKDLQGKYVVLNYSFGHYWNEDLGGDDLLTIWRINGGKLDEWFHPHEPNTLEKQVGLCEQAVALLKERRIRKVYTPSSKTFYRGKSFLGLERENTGGEHSDEEGVTDWIEYQNICDDDENWDALKKGGLEIEVFDLDI